MTRRRRIVTTIRRAGQLAPEDALRFEVVRGVLTQALTLEEGARKLACRSSSSRGSSPVRGAPSIRALGEEALEAARRSSRRTRRSTYAMLGRH